MKRIYTFILTLAILAATSAAGYAGTDTAIARGADSVPEIKFIESEEMTAEILETRADRYILIECIHGVCIDDAGNGRTSDGYYISYKGVAGAGTGKEYKTLCLYANNNYIDDIVQRIDMEV